MRLIIIFISLICFERLNAQTTYDCLPIGWNTVLSNARNVVTGVDSIVKRSGRASGFMKRPPTETLGGGALKQVVDAGPYKGQHVRLTAYIKALDLESAALWFRADKLDTAVSLLSVTIQLHDSTGWRPYSITMDVPQEALFLQFGINVQNEGTIWVDDLEIEIVDKSVPAFNNLSEDSRRRQQPPRYFPINPKPVNMGFEDQ